MTAESKLFLISAASGTGKSSLINSAMNELENIGKKVELSISYTTRDERSDNQDFYFFISKENFQDKINDNFFLEHAEVHGNMYGTSREFVQEKLFQGINLILEIDVQGVQSIKNKTFPCESIFLLPPSMQSLSDRLHSRGTNSRDNIDLRIKNAYSEIFHAKKYDHILINDDFEECCKNLVSIIQGENAFPFDDAKEMFLKKLLY